MGALLGLAFTPIYFLPGCFSISYLIYQIRQSNEIATACKKTYLFSFGFLLASLYWISFSIFVYIEDFWWAFPFALLGLPAFLALFYLLVPLLIFRAKNSPLYILYFISSWLLVEWILGWAFTGFPWAMLGYIFTVSDIFSQSVKLFSMLGLSAVIIYVGGMFSDRKNFLKHFILSVILLCSMYIYGDNTLKQTKIEYHDISVRIVQPSIPQKSKWSIEKFFDNLDRHIKLSSAPGKTDIIIWSESALGAPYQELTIAYYLSNMLKNTESLLITGTVTPKIEGNEEKLYISMLALDQDLQEVFVHHKAHLVPFGEYIPYSKWLPFKKLTHGITDYSQGTRMVQQIPQLNLKIYPLICYESIFSEEILANIADADVMINVTNDAWYGNSSGPYQHFAINKMRAIETGVPLLRAANNGISAILDPLGREIAVLQLNDIGVIEHKIPKKIEGIAQNSETRYICLAILMFVIGLVL